MYSFGMLILFAEAFVGDEDKTTITIGGTLAAVGVGGYLGTWVYDIVGATLSCPISPDSPSATNAFLIALLTAPYCPGLGHIYAGKTLTGILMLSASLLSNDIGIALILFLYDLIGSPIAAKKKSKENSKNINIHLLNGFSYSKLNNNFQLNIATARF